MKFKIELDIADLEKLDEIARMENGTRIDFSSTLELFRLGLDAKLAELRKLSEMQAVRS